MKTRHATSGQRDQLLVVLLGMLDHRSLGFEAMQYLVASSKDEFNRLMIDLLKGLRPPQNHLPRDYSHEMMGLGEPAQLFPHVRPVQFFDREWVSLCDPEDRTETVTRLLSSGGDPSSQLYGTLDHGTMRYFFSRDRRSESQKLNEWNRMWVVGWKDGVIVGGRTFFPVIDQVSLDCAQVSWKEKDWILERMGKNPEKWPIVTMVPVSF